MHGLPDFEVALELDMRVGRCKGLRPCSGVDDPAIDDLDDATTASQVFGERGSRGRGVGSYSHGPLSWERLREQIRRPESTHGAVFPSRGRLRRIEPRHVSALSIDEAAT